MVRQIPVEIGVQAGVHQCDRFGVFTQRRPLNYGHIRGLVRDPGQERRECSA